MNTTRQNASARNERDANRLLAEQITFEERERAAREVYEPRDPEERPPLVKGDRGAILFACALLVAFWVVVALLLRSCS